MPQLSPKFSYLKGHFRVQTEKTQAQLFGEVYLTREVVLSPLSRVPQVSLSNPVTPLRLFQQHRQDLAGPDAGKAKRCDSEKQKHLSTTKAGFWFRSCIILFRGLEKQHAGVAPSARSVDGSALRAICGFPYRSCGRGLCVFGLDVVSEAQK